MTRKIIVFVMMMTLVGSTLGTAQSGSQSGFDASDSATGRQLSWLIWNDPWLFMDIVRLRFETKEYKDVNNALADGYIRNRSTASSASAIIHMG